MQTGAFQHDVAVAAAGYLAGNKVSVDEIPLVIATIAKALRGLDDDGGNQTAVTQKGRSGAVTAPAAAKTTTRSLARSVAEGGDVITCLKCNRGFKLLKRHLMRAHEGMTPEVYRKRYSLAADAPMITPGYAFQRSEMAKASGLGRRRKGI